MKLHSPRRQTIGSRIFVGYGVIMALGMFFLLLVVSMLVDANARQVAALEQRQKLETGRLALELALEKEAGAVRGYLLRGDQGDVEAYIEGLLEHQRALDSLSELVASETSATALVAVREQYDKFGATASRIIQDPRGGSLAERDERQRTNLAFWQREGNAAKDALRRVINEFVEIEQRAIETNILQADERRFQVYMLTLLMFVVAGVSVVLSGRRLTRSITLPVGRLVQVAQAFSQGQLEQRAPIQTQDELATLARVMNDMASNLALSRRAAQVSLHHAEHRNRQLAALNSIAETLSHSLDLHLILERTLDHVLHLANLYRGWVWLLEGQSFTSTPEVTRHIFPDEFTALRSADQRQRLLELALQGEVAVMSQAEAFGHREEQTLEAFPGPCLLIPLAARDRTLGLMSLSGSADRRFEGGEIEFFQAIGRQIAVGIENARLFAAEQRLTKEALGLADTARLVSGSLQLDEILPIIVRSGVSLLNVDCCVIFLFPEDQLSQQSIYQDGLTETQQRLLNLKADRVQAVVTEYADAVDCLPVPDVAADERADLREVLSWMSVRSALVVALQTRRQPVGVIFFGTMTHQRNFSAQDQRVAVALADQASVAIENALLYAGVEERASQLAGLYEIGKVVSATLDPEELYGVLYRETRQLMDADAFFVALISPDQDTLRFVFRMDGGQRDPTETTAASTGLSGYLIATREPLMADRARLVTLGIEEEVSATHKRQAESVLGVPLVREGRVLGVMSTQSYRVNAYTRQHLELFVAIANQAAIAVENTKLHQQALGLAVVEERNRLARELHDSVTQMLFSITLTLQAGRVLLKKKPTQAEAQMDKAQQTAHEALAEMRSLIHQLRPASMQERGLVAALAGYLDAFRSRTGLNVTFHHRGECLLNEAQEQALFRIAQEALNNIVKHAQARQVEVDLVREDEGVILSVRDDGRGFSTSRPAGEPRTWGLIGMRERAELLGGALHIESVPNQGTLVQARLPQTREQLVASHVREEA